MAKEEKIEKNKLGSEPEKVHPEGDMYSTSGEIEVGKPLDIKRELPLVIKIPANSSSAQVAYAKMLNSYAYQNPTKWEAKKELLISRLKLLAGVELSEQEKLSLKGSKTSFVFTKDKTTGKELYSGMASAVGNA